jgi:hypothetical protein
MKVMGIVKASNASDAGEMPSQELLATVGDYSEELGKPSMLLAGKGLHPSSKGKRMRFPARIARSSMDRSQNPRS